MVEKKNLVSKIVPKMSKHAYQNLSKNLSIIHPKPLSLPNIHDHLHKQHFNICKSNLHDPNLSKYVHKLLHTNQKSNIGHIQTSQKTIQSKKQTSQKPLQSKNKPLQHRSHTNHYIPKNKKHVKKYSMPPFWPFLFLL
jgi:hypothetical protein